MPSFVPAIGRKKKHRPAVYLLWIMLFVKQRLASNSPEQPHRVSFFPGMIIDSFVFEGKQLGRGLIEIKNDLEQD